MSPTVPFNAPLRLLLPPPQTVLLVILHNPTPFPILPHLPLHILHAADCPQHLLQSSYDLVYNTTNPRPDLSLTNSRLASFTLLPSLRRSGSSSPAAMSLPMPPLTLKTTASAFLTTVFSATVAPSTLNAVRERMTDVLSSFPESDLQTQALGGVFFVFACMAMGREVASRRAMQSEARGRGGITKFKTFLKVVEGEVVRR